MKRQPQGQHGVVGPSQPGRVPVPWRSIGTDEPRFIEKAFYQKPEKRFELRPVLTFTDQDGMAVRARRVSQCRECEPSGARRSHFRTAMRGFQGRDPVPRQRRRRRSAILKCLGFARSPREGIGRSASMRRGTQKGSVVDHPRSCGRSSATPPRDAVGSHRHFRCCGRTDSRRG